MATHFSFLTQSHVTLFFTQKSRTKNEGGALKMNFLASKWSSLLVGCVCTYVLCTQKLWGIGMIVSSLLLADP